MMLLKSITTAGRNPWNLHTKPLPIDFYLKELQSTSSNYWETLSVSYNKLQLVSYRYESTQHIFQHLSLTGILTPTLCQMF